MSSPQIERKLAAIMFTDIAGYTAQMSKDEAVAISLLNKKESVLKPLIAKHNGTYVKSTGDGSLSHFNSAVDAATCAKRLQESIYDDKDLNVRVGVHLGDTIFEKGDIRGDGVNIASRLESMAVAGGVFVSKEVHDQLANQKEFEGVSLGLQSMKGVGRLIEVYGLKGDKISEPNPSEYQDNKIAVHSDDEVPSIAIIPFDNKGADEDVFYAYGISVDLISDVSSAGLIRVASKKQIEDAGDLPQDELAKKLDVRYMANGELWRMGDMFQLSVELYDTKDKKVVWSDRWQEKWDNLPMIKGSLSDGLLKALDTTSKVERKIETTNIEAYEFYLKAKHKNKKRENIEDTKIARGLLNKAIELDDNLIIAKIEIGNIYFQTGEFEEALEIYQSTLNQAKQSGDKKIVGRIFVNIGLTYGQYSDYDKAMENYYSALNIFEEYDDKDGIGSSLMNIGRTLMIKGDNKESLKIYFRCLDIFEELDKKDKIGVLFDNIAIAYHYIGNHKKVLNYLNRGLQLKEEIGNKSGMGYTIGFIGTIFYLQKDLDQGLEYLTRSIAIHRKFDDKYGIALVLNNFGNIYSIKGDYEKALEYYNRSLKMYEKQGDRLGIKDVLCNLGGVYSMKDDYKKAKEYFEKSIPIIKEIQTGTDELLDATVSLYFAYKNLGKEYDQKEVHSLIKDAEDIDYDLNYRIYHLFEDTSYLETAYNQIQEKADNLEPDIKAKFLSYPIPKAIVEEWEKVN